MQMSLREAAKQARTSKSTILRAIQSGRLSATRTEEGNYQIDPAELLRVYPPDRPMTSASPRDTTGVRAASATDDVVGTRIRNASLEAQVQALREMLEAEKRRSDEIRSERDSWRTQAERLLLAASLVTPPPPSPPPVITPAPEPTPPAPEPTPVITPAPEPTPVTTPRRPWWRRWSIGHRHDTLLTE